MKPLLQSASPELVKKLFKFGHKRSFVESDVIFAEGEKAKFLPIVLTGKVKMVRAAWGNT